MADSPERVIAEALNERLGGKAGFLTYADCDHHASIAIAALTAAGYVVEKHRPPTPRRAQEEQ